MNVITPPHPNEQKSNKSTRPSTKRVPTTTQPGPLFRRWFSFADVQRFHAKFISSSTLICPLHGTVDMEVS